MTREIPVASSPDVAVNRHDRRKAKAVERKSRRLLRLRCSGCDRVGLPMTKEHFFPRWLIDYAQVHHEGITWFDGQTVDPDNATIPLCRECNEAFGTVLEGPVAEIFRQLEQGASISEDEAELLVRWLWKFEGLHWTAMTNRPECSATIWMGTQRQSGWPFRRSRREDDCRGPMITQAIFS